MPASPANVTNRDVGPTPSVNSVCENELRKAVQNLTTTVKYLSNDLGALKLKLDEQSSLHHLERNMQVRPRRSPSPHGRSPDRTTNAWSSGYGHSPSRYSRSHHSSPERYPHVNRHHQDFTHREPDRYRQPYRETHYSACDPYEERRWRQTSPSRHHYDSRR